MGGPGSGRKKGGGIGKRKATLGKMRGISTKHGLDTMKKISDKRVRGAKHYIKGK